MREVGTGFFGRRIVGASKEGGRNGMGREEKEEEWREEEEQREVIMILNMKIKEIR